MSTQTRTRVLKSEDLRWLACPVCREPVALDAGCVLCTVCRRRYPVVDGIPILLAARAF
jgi:uncharacterized protein YbaR (Trm112 family)